MNGILTEIVANKKLEVALAKENTPLSELIDSPLFLRKVRSLKASIGTVEFGIIAEIKRKSPSGGDIFPGLSPIDQAQYYQENGAKAISVLTDLKYFGGSMRDLTAVSNVVDIPVLRKEFIIDEYQIYEAKAGGADAILLIAMILTKEEILKFTQLAHEIGLEVLFEVHDNSELNKIVPNLDLIAVNNRNLDHQTTSLEHSFNLVNHLPKNTPLISASGISTAIQIQQLHTVGFAGALVGESILRKKNLEQLTIIETL